MNQITIQERANAIVQNNRIIRHQNNIWCVQSANVKTPNKFYRVMYDEGLDSFMCDCKAFEFTLEPCKHILALALGLKEFQRERGVNN